MDKIIKRAAQDNRFTIYVHCLFVIVCVFHLKSFVGVQVQRVDAVILLDWSDRSLERQIQLGAKTGDIDINLARFEMTNYKSNIIPVAQFFDQQGRLHIVRLYATISIWSIHFVVKIRTTS